MVISSLFAIYFAQCKYKYRMNYDKFKLYFLLMFKFNDFTLIPVKLYDILKYKKYDIKQLENKIDLIINKVRTDEEFKRKLMYSIFNVKAIFFDKIW